MAKQFYIYIMTNHRRTVFYTGITNDLVRRGYEHKSHLQEGFTKKYNIDRLVYFEFTDNPLSAISREKQVKNYRRSKKIELIEKQNPKWEDLYAKISSSSTGSLVSASQRLEMTVG